MADMVNHPTHGTYTDIPTPPWVQDMSRRVENDWAEHFGGRDVRATIRDAAQDRHATLPPLHSLPPGETKPLMIWDPGRQPRRQPRGPETNP